MSNLINLNTHTIEILTKKNMSHLIAFNLNNEAIPVKRSKRIAPEYI